MPATIAHYAPSRVERTTVVTEKGYDVLGLIRADKVYCPLTTSLAGRPSSARSANCSSPAPTSVQGRPGCPPPPADRCGPWVTRAREDCTG